MVMVHVLHVHVLVPTTGSGNLGSPIQPPHALQATDCPLPVGFMLNFVQFQCFFFTLAVEFI